MNLDPSFFAVFNENPVSKTGESAQIGTTSRDSGTGLENTVKYGMTAEPSSIKSPRSASPTTVCAAKLATSPVLSRFSFVRDTLFEGREGLVSADGRVTNPNEPGVVETASISASLSSPRRRLNPGSALSPTVPTSNGGAFPPTTPSAMRPLIATPLSSTMPGVRTERLDLSSSGAGPSKLLLRSILPQTTPNRLVTISRTANEVFMDNQTHGDVASLASSEEPSGGGSVKRRQRKVITYPSLGLDTAVSSHAPVVDLPTSAMQPLEADQSSSVPESPKKEQATTQQTTTENGSESRQEEKASDLSRPLSQTGYNRWAATSPEVEELTKTHFITQPTELLEAPSTFSLVDFNLGFARSKANESILQRAQTLARAVLTSFNRLNSEALAEERARVRALEHSIRQHDLTSDDSSASTSYAAALGYQHGWDEHLHEDRNQPSDGGSSSQSPILEENQSTTSVSRPRSHSSVITEKASHFLGHFSFMSSSLRSRLQQRAVEHHRAQVGREAVSPDTESPIASSDAMSEGDLAAMTWAQRLKLHQELSSYRQWLEEAIADDAGQTLSARHSLPTSNSFVSQALARREAQRTLALQTRAATRAVLSELYETGGLIKVRSPSAVESASDEEEDNEMDNQCLSQFYETEEGSKYGYSEPDLDDEDLDSQFYLAYAHEASHQREPEQPQASEDANLARDVCSGPARPLLTPDIVSQFEPEVLARVSSELLLPQRGRAGQFDERLSEEMAYETAAVQSNKLLEHSVRQHSSLLQKERKNVYLPSQRLRELLANSLLQQVPLRVHETVTEARIRKWTRILVEAITLQAANNEVNITQDNSNDTTSARRTPSALELLVLRAKLGQQPALRDPRLPFASLGRKGADIRLLERLISRAVEIALLEEEDPVGAIDTQLDMATDQGKETLDDRHAGNNSAPVLYDPQRASVPTESEPDPQAREAAIYYLSTRAELAAGTAQLPFQDLCRSPSPTTPLPTSSSTSDKQANLSNLLNQLSGFSVSSAAATHVAPALEGLKPSTVFVTSPSVPEQERSKIQELEERIKRQIARDTVLEAQLASAATLLDQANAQQAQQLTTALGSDIHELSRRLTTFETALQVVTRAERLAGKSPAEQARDPDQDLLSVARLKRCEDEIKAAHAAVKKLVDTTNQRNELLIRLTGAGVGDVRPKVASATAALQRMEPALVSLSILKSRATCREAVAKLDPARTAKLSDADAQSLLRQLNDLLAQEKDPAVISSPEYQAAKVRSEQPAKPAAPAPAPATAKAATPAAQKPAAAAVASAPAASAPAASASATPAASAAPAAKSGPANPILANALALNAKYTAAEKIYQNLEETASPEVLKELNKLRRKCTSCLVKVSATMESVRLNVTSFREVLSTPITSGPVDPAHVRTYLLFHTARELVSQGDTRPTAHAHFAFYLSQLFPEFLPLLIASFHMATVLTIPSIPAGVDDNPELCVKKLRMKLLPDGKLENIDDFLNRVHPIIVLYLSFMTLDMRPYGNQIKHPHGMSECWTWVAAVVNSEPCFCTATVIDAFLGTAGGVFLQHYPNQGRKIMMLIQSHILPRIQNMPVTAKGAAGASLKRIVSALETYAQTGVLPIPPQREIAQTSGVAVTFSAQDIQASLNLTGV